MHTLISVGKDKKETISKFARLVTDHSHVDPSEKMTILFFSKYTPQADKIQKKKVASKPIIEKPREEDIMEIEEEEKENPIDQRKTEPLGENNNLQQIFNNNISYNNGKVLCSSFWMIVRLFQ